MTSETFAELESLSRESGQSAVLEKLQETLLAEKQYHRLFDARLLAAKHALGIASARPTSFDDVPDEHLETFRKAYIDAAREVGGLLLEEGQIAQAWIYFRTIQEPAAIKAALEAYQPPPDADEALEELIGVALYEGAHPVKGLELMLNSHGTCNTITATDQQMANMGPEDRREVARLLVRHLYEELSQSLRHHVEQRMPMVPPNASVRELIAGRDWLFADGNYHIDVSHLNAVVRFARSLDRECPELQQAIELAEYGSHLDGPLQYGGDPPFDEFYTAHVKFLKALAGEDVDDALAYFREKLDAEPDEPDKQMIAYVMVDLLMRLDRLGEAVDLAKVYLKDIEDAAGFSFNELCREAGRLDELRTAAEERGDLVSYAAALIQPQ
jgi:tetratricopeptide (TPR) repeat protein